MCSIGESNVILNLGFVWGRFGFAYYGFWVLGFGFALELENLGFVLPTTPKSGVLLGESMVFLGQTTVLCLQSASFQDLNSWKSEGRGSSSNLRRLFCLSSYVLEQLSCSFSCILGFEYGLLSRRHLAK
jgi:hypothetical protein